jgi:hypothetical protein
MEPIVEKTENEKFWRASPSEGPWLRLAQVISRIANPLFVALPLCLLIALSTAPDIIQALVWWTVTAVGVSVAPLLFIGRGVRQGHYTDHHVSRREQRLVPLLFAAGCMVIVLVLLFLLHASPELIATVTAMITTCVIALVITQFWKISLHVVGMAGAVTILGLVVGPLLFLLSPLVLLVGWARWRVEAHTPLQPLAGIVLAVSVTVAIFWLFGVL